MQLNPEGIFQTRVYGVDGLQTRVSGYPGLIMSVRRAAGIIVTVLLSGFYTQNFIRH